MSRWWCVLGLTVVGCKAPEEAPEDLGQLTLYLFQHFDSEEGEMEAGTLELEVWLDSLDLEGGVNDRAVTPPVLTDAYLGGVDKPQGADPQAQVPVAVAGLSRHDLDANVGLVAEENHVCIESDTTVYYGRVFETDIDCFLDGSCLRVETTNEIRKENLLAKVWYDLEKDYRMIELEDGRTAMIARSWMPVQYFGDGGNNSIDQSYTFEAWIPGNGGKTKRFYSMWSSVTLSGVGDDTYGALVKSGLDEGYQNADDFVDGEMCGNDRARPYDRPQE